MAANSRPLVYVCSSIKGLSESLLKKRPDLLIKNVPITASEFTKDPVLPNETKREISNAELILSEPHWMGQVLYDMPKLKWMHLTWAGIDSLIKYMDKEQPVPGYKVSRFGGVFGEHMAEYVIGQIIATERAFFEMIEDKKEKNWNNKNRKSYRLLKELKLGILGMGDISKNVAGAAKSFGMTVWGLTKRPVTEDRRCKHVDKYILLNDLPEMLQSCDYLCSVLPSTPDTKGLLSGDKLSLCKNKKTVFISIGRGDVIDEASILHAVRNGWLYRAVLDVQPEEPVPQDSPLWNEPNIFISPHVSAVSFAYQVVDTFLDNYDRYVAGQDLKYEVNLSEGY